MIVIEPPAETSFNRRFLDRECPVILRGFLGQPVAEVEVFLDFTPLVTIFERLFWLMVRFAKRVLRVTDGFTDGLHGLHHSILPFLTVARLKA